MDEGHDYQRPLSVQFSRPTRDVAKEGDVAGRLDAALAETDDGAAKGEMVLPQRVHARCRDSVAASPFEEDDH